MRLGRWISIVALPVSVLFAVEGALAASASGNPAPAPLHIKEQNYTASSNGLKYAMMKGGSGAAAKSGDRVVVQYTGWIEKTGEKFDSSLDRGQPLTFKIGDRQALTDGWQAGVAGMKAGEKRQMRVPGQNAPGITGRVQGGSDLLVQVELLKILPATR